MIGLVLALAVALGKPGDIEGALECPNAGASITATTTDVLLTLTADGTGRVGSVDTLGILDSSGAEQTTGIYVNEITFAGVVIWGDTAETYAWPWSSETLGPYLQGRSISDGETIVFRLENKGAAAVTGFASGVIVE